MIRVCANDHITGTKKCYCGAKAVRLLGDRDLPSEQQPGANALRIYRKTGVWIKAEDPQNHPAPRAATTRPRYRRVLGNIRTKLTAKVRHYQEHVFGVKTSRSS